VIVVEPDAFGVYVHVPFCRHRCDYCAFATYSDRDHLMTRYVDACVAELTKAAHAGELPRATSVFFGGGTPSRLPADELCRILSVIPLAPSCEITVECNPEDATDERLRTYRDGGVNRMSFGIQSTVPRVLDALGRRHGRELVPHVADLASSIGFDSYNFDLILGAVGESDEDWEQTVDEVLSLPSPPPHVSVYALTVEPGTPLAADPGRHPDPDVQASRYEWADRRLAAHGYRWEEISNWARPGHRCRHNQLYWHQGDYLGIGSGAHSHRGGRRWWNVRTPDRYVAAVESTSTAVAGSETLTPRQRDEERLALLIRTPDGVPEAALPDAPELEGLVDRRDGRAVLTVRGRLVADALTTRLVVGRAAAQVPAGILPG
jgi:oxygen-independent coproporphyrinogen-3 oxidase